MVLDVWVQSFPNQVKLLNRMSTPKLELSPSTDQLSLSSVLYLKYFEIQKSYKDLLSLIRQYPLQLDSLVQDINVLFAIHTGLSNVPVWLSTKLNSSIESRTLMVYAFERNTSRDFRAISIVSVYVAIRYGVIVFLSALSQHQG